MSITASPARKFPVLASEGLKSPGSAIYGTRQRNFEAVTGLCQSSVGLGDAHQRGMSDCAAGAREVEGSVKRRPFQGLEAFLMIEFPSLRIMLAALLTAAVGMMTTVAAAVR